MYFSVRFNPVWTVRRETKGSTMKLSSVIARTLGALTALSFSALAAPASAQDSATDTTTMIVVDMSGSMLKLLGSERRYEIAQSMLVDVLPDVTAQSNTGLVAFGHRSENDCSDIELFAKPGASLDNLRGYVSTLSPVNRAKTPLRDSVALAANQIPADSQGAIVVVSDGEDNCGVNVCDLVPTLKNRGIPVFLLGIALEEESIEQIQCLSSDTGGFLIQTESAAELPRYADFLFRLSRLRTSNAQLEGELARLRALLADQQQVQSDLENQIIILTQRLADADRTEELTALQAEIARLRAANDDKQQRITGLAAAILVLEQDKTTLTAENTAKQAEIDRLNALIAQLQDRLNGALANQRDADEIAALKAEIARLNAMVDSLNADLAEANTANAKLARLIEDLSAENQGLSSENAQLLLQIESLTGAVEGLSTDNDTLRAEIARLEALLAENNRTLVVLQGQANTAGDKDAQIAELLARVQELEASDRSLRADLKRVTLELSGKDQIIENRDATIAQVRRTIESLNGLLARKNAVIASLNEQIATLRESLSAVGDKDEEIARLNTIILALRDDLNTNEVTITDLTSSLDEARQSIVMLGDSAGANEVQIETLSAGIEQMRQQANQLTIIIDERDQAIITLMDQLTEAQSAAAAAENTVLVLQSEADALSGNKESLEQQIILLEGQQSEWLSERRSLTIERDEAVAAKGGSDLEVDTLNIRITDVTEERDALDALVIDLRDRLNAAYIEIDSLKTSNEDLSAQVRALELELEERTRIIDELMIELASVTQERDTLLIANTELTATNENLLLIIEEKDVEIEDLTLDLRALRMTLDEARMALGDERIRTRRLHLQLEEARGSFLNLLSSCHTDEEMAVFAEAKFEDLGDAARACIGDYSALIIERDTLVDDLMTRTAERNALQTTLSEQDPNYAVLRDRVAELEAQQDSLLAIIAAASGNDDINVTLIERDLTLVIEERDRLRAELTAQDPAYDLVVSRLAVVEAENERLVALLDRQDPGYDEVILQLEQVTMERDHLISVLDSQDPSYIVLKSQVENLTAERDRLLALVSVQNPSYETIANRLEVVTIERDRLAAALAEQTPSYSVIKAQLEEALISLESCETSRRNMTEELARLQRVVRENNTFIESRRNQLDDQEAYIALLVTGASSAAELEAICAAQ